MRKIGHAIAFTSDLFKDIVDKGGNAYILHCLYVAHKVRNLGEDVYIAAILHDVIEDTETTLDDLKILGFSKVTIDIVRLLTHSPLDSYKEYINKVAVCPKARAIKMADLAHNSLIHRMKGLTEKDFARLEKYHHAYKLLKELGDSNV